jgi:hypothetical protein
LHTMSTAVWLTWIPNGENFTHGRVR